MAFKTIVKGTGKVGVFGVAVIIAKNDLNLFGNADGSIELMNSVKSKMPPKVADVCRTIRSNLTKLSPSQIVTNARKGFAERERKGGIINSVRDSLKERGYL